MLKDRGNIKWTSLMLPEHVGVLRKWAEDIDKVPRPELDEQEWSEIEVTIHDAMTENKPLTFTYLGRRVLSNVNRSSSLCGHKQETISDS